MAINQQVIMPRPQEDAFDKLIKGLQIAQGVYGIKTAIEQSDLRKLQMDRAKQQQEQGNIDMQMSKMDLDAKTRKTELEKYGILPKNYFNEKYFKVDEKKVESLMKKFDNYPLQPVLINVENNTSEKGYEPILAIDKDEIKAAQKALMDAKKLDLANRMTDKKNQPKPSAGAFESAGFAERIMIANQGFDELEQSGFDRSDLSTAIRSSVTKPFGEIGEYFKDPKLKLWDQSARNFINAVLRRESGAAIAESEFDSAEKQYFPVAGDTDQVKEQKRRNRKTVEQALLREAQYGLTGEIIPILQDAQNRISAGSFPFQPGKVMQNTSLVPGGKQTNQIDDPIVNEYLKRYLSE